MSAADEAGGLRGVLLADPRDAIAQRRLSRMKRTATGALAFAAVVYVAAVVAGDDSGVLGFVRTGAEAAMIGGLADWFAVTALFRRPLGLPIPHTGLIPRKKDELATKLGEFVTGHFLTHTLVSKQITEARLVHRLGVRLAEPDTSQAASRELASFMSAVLGALDDHNAADYVLELIRRDLARRSYAPVLGRLLARGIEGRGHRPLIEMLITTARTYLTDHRATLRPQVRKFLEEQGVFGWLIASDRRSDRALDEALALLAAMSDDAEHPLRVWLDGLLASVATALQDESAPPAHRIDEALRALLEDAQIQRVITDLVGDALASTRESLAEGGGELQQRLAALIRDAGQRVTSDPEFEDRLERVLLRAVRYVVENYGDTVVSLIQRTVAGWEARDAAERIELAVGRDLQFIRINGTVVGALAGLAIHAATVLLG